MLKADLHLHVCNDPKDGKSIKYNVKELIDFMSKKGFDVIALTPHLYNNIDEGIKEYAKTKNILLIFGAELRLEGKDILVYNFNNKLEKVKKIKDLKKVKSKNNLIIAPHPFFFPHSLRKKLIKNIKIFDAIEYSHFYTKKFNLNKKAVKVSKRYNIPLIGNSDTHHFCQVGQTYTYINSKKEINSIFNAIRKGNVQLKTRPLCIKKFLKIFL